MNNLELLKKEDLENLNYSGEIVSKITIVPDKKLSGDQGLVNRLAKAKKSGKKFVILGAPEGIGPYANKGRNGAYGAWPAFLSIFSDFLEQNIADRLLILGKVKLDDLQRKSKYYDNYRQKDRRELRKMVAIIDARLSPILRSIMEAGLIPILIGGGHNNAFPLIKEAAQLTEEKKISCLNLDLHADLRSTDGRHSGNSFSYAFEKGLLNKYYIFGLHENYHSNSYYKKVQDLRSKGKIDYSTYTNITSQLQTSFEIELNKAENWFQEYGQNMGLEVDLDSVEGVPASAITEVRVPFSFTRKFVQRTAKEFAPMYFNLSEGAPDLGKRNSKKVVGRSISRLILDFINNYQK